MGFYTRIWVEISKCMSFITQFSLCGAFLLIINYHGLILQNNTINMHNCVKGGGGQKKTNNKKEKKKDWKQRNSLTKDSLLIFLSYHIWLLIHTDIMSQSKGSIQTHKHSDRCSHPPSQKAADNSIRTKKQQHWSSLCWPRPPPPLPSPYPVQEYPRSIQRGVDSLFVHLRWCAVRCALFR